MTESINDNNSYPKSDLGPPRVAEVFFDSGGSVELYEVDVRPITIAVGQSQQQFDELVMHDGTILAPAEYLSYEGDDRLLVDFGRELEPVPPDQSPTRAPSIRTRDVYSNTRFLNAVHMQGSNVHPLPGRHNASSRQDAESYYERLQQLHSYEPGLWLRLEGKDDADEHIRGKVLIAKLVLFITEIVDVRAETYGIFPAILNYNESKFHLLPEQLRLVDPWLYVQLDDDPEDKQL